MQAPRWRHPCSAIATHVETAPMRRRSHVRGSVTDQLAIAVEVSVAVAIATAMAPGAMRHPEYAFDRTDGSADAGTNSASDHASHRPRDPMTFMSALLGTSHDPLCAGQLRQREPGERQSKNGESCEQSGQSLRRTVGKGHRPGLAIEHDMSW